MGYQDQNYWGLAGSLDNKDNRILRLSNPATNLPDLAEIHSLFGFPYQPKILLYRL
jgi:hypothetical protein